MIVDQRLLNSSTQGSHENDPLQNKSDHPQLESADAPEPYDARKFKILVVDDDESIRSLLIQILGAWGYQTVEAESISGALAAVEQEQPDAVLLDVKLPDGSGIFALDELRKRAPELVIIIITGYVTHEDAFAAGVRQAYGYVTKPIHRPQLRAMLEAAFQNLKARVVKQHNNSFREERRQRPAGEGKRGRPQRQTAAPLGNLILNAMKLLGLSYKDIVTESGQLSDLNKNTDMRIGKSTLGNIISGSIRQPGTAKLDSLRIILNLSRADMDAAIGLQPERRFTEQLDTTRARTHEVSIDAVTRYRKIKLPIVREEEDLQNTQFFEGSLKRWIDIEVEYLSSFYPPYLGYVVVGEEDTNAAPIAPPGSRLLVNKLLTTVHPPENVSFHERELFYVLTPNGLTCMYAEIVGNEKIVLIPHPASGNVREEFFRDEVTIIGQVVGVLYPS